MIQFVRRQVKCCACFVDPKAIGLVFPKGFCRTLLAKLVQWTTCKWYSSCGSVSPVNKINLAVGFKHTTITDTKYRSAKFITGEHCQIDGHKVFTGNLKQKGAKLFSMTKGFTEERGLTKLPARVFVEGGTSFRSLFAKVTAEYHDTFRYVCFS